MAFFLVKRGQSLRIYMVQDLFQLWATPEKLATALANPLVGRQIFTFETIASTNDWLKAQARLNADLGHGSLAVANFQTTGRGRQNRAWFAPPDTSLMQSLFLRLGWASEQVSWVTMMAGVAMAASIESVTGIKVALKWPNDLIVEDVAHGYRKLGGILAESNWDDGRLVSVVLGVGLNVNMPAFSLPPTVPPATSLLLETGQPVSRLALLKAYLHNLDDLLQQANQGISPQPAWLARLVWLGQTVCVRQGESELIGIAEGVDEWGQLLVRENAGILHTISAADVSLRKNVVRDA
jgi:BirA family biotin operon repressor/biotin-[acetyl-CoA-carboxylase] ligase